MSVEVEKRNLDALLGAQQSILKMLDAESTPESKELLRHLASLAHMVVQRAGDGMSDVSRVLGFVQGALWAMMEMRK